MLRGGVCLVGGNASFVESVLSRSRTRGALAAACARGHAVLDRRQHDGH